MEIEKSKNKQLNWGRKVDFEVIHQIAKRASIMAQLNGFRYDVLGASMDIMACHNNGCPLKLQELLNADDGNFAHDVFGIRANINRKTGKIENCFLPRYAVQ